MYLQLTITHNITPVNSNHYGFPEMYSSCRILSYQLSVCVSIILGSFVSSAFGSV